MSPTSIQLRLDLESVAHDVARFGSGCACAPAGGTRRDRRRPVAGQRRRRPAGGAAGRPYPVPQRPAVRLPGAGSGRAGRPERPPGARSRASAWTARSAPAPGLRLHRVRPHPGPPADIARAPLLRRFAGVRTGIECRRTWCPGRPAPLAPANTDDRRRAGRRRRRAPTNGALRPGGARPGPFGAADAASDRPGLRPAGAPMLGARAGSCPTLPM